MTKQDRFRYYASREWALKKEAVKERNGGRCERCKVAPHESTHHLTYERFGHELPEDLLGVCGPCHEFLSGKRDDDPTEQVANYAYLAISEAWDWDVPVLSSALDAIGKNSLAEKIRKIRPILEEIEKLGDEFGNILREHVDIWREGMESYESYQRGG